MKLIGDTLLCAGTFWDGKNNIQLSSFCCKGAPFTLEGHDCFKAKKMQGFPKYMMPY